MTTEASSARHFPQGAALTLIVLGAFLFLCGPIMGLTFATGVGLSSTLGQLKNQVHFNGQTTMESDAGGTYFLYAPEPTLPDAASCTVTLGTGKTIAVKPAPRQQNTNIGWKRFESFARFTLDADSSAAITCSHQAGGLVVGRQFNPASLLGQMGTWYVSAGGLMAAVGFAIAILGIMRYPRRSHASQPPTPASGWPK